MQLYSTRSNSLAGPTTPFAGTRRAPAFRSRRQQALLVRSVLEMNRPKAGAKAAGGAEAAAAKEDVQRELQYRIVTDKTDAGKLYQGVAWSVHNRLVDAFERTDAYWK